MTRLDVGTRAPEFTLLDHDGRPRSLSEFAGRRVVLYFYSADDTPGCTKEACQFNDHLAAFDGARTTIVGVSPDGAAQHVSFRQKFGLNFTLLSDPDRAVMTSYGAFGEKTLYGKKTLGVIRSTFLVGPTGLVERAWYHVRSDGHAARVLATLER